MKTFAVIQLFNSHGGPEALFSYNPELLSENEAIEAIETALEEVLSENVDFEETEKSPLDMAEEQFLNAQGIYRLLAGEAYTVVL